jgi:hypothetical protein
VTRRQVEEAGAKISRLAPTMSPTAQARSPFASHRRRSVALPKITRLIATSSPYCVRGCSPDRARAAGSESRALA